MYGITDFGLFCFAVLLLNVTPGPDTAYIVGRSVAQGRWAGVISALGISAGCCVHSLASAFGLTAILAASAQAFTAIKLIGAAYLLWLGVRMIWATRKAPAADATAPDANDGVRSARRLFWQGFLTNVLNPKVVLFFLSFFPQFVHADSTQKPLAFLALGAVFVFLSTIYNSSVAWVAGSVTRRMRDRPGVKQWLERGVGAAFIGIGVKLALTGQKS